jgi:hypothetical protein
MENSFSPAKKTAMYIIAIVAWFALASQFYFILQTTNET